MKRFVLLSLLSVVSITSLCSCTPSNDNHDDKKPLTGIHPISIFGINDFHGAINENYKEAGIANIGTFIKQKTAEENTLFIDSGDTWQGSLESNYNKGKLINEVFNNAKMSVRTLGNHDFDWGIEVLKSNVKNCNFPNLAANVYGFDWDNKEVLDEQQSELGDCYATFDLENGLKVGVIGTIGEDQITSISTQLVENITFTNQTKVIQNVSDYLRVEKKCDIVIASSHSSYYQMEPYEITKVSKVSNKRYVDLVLNAHTHQSENFKCNNVLFAQFGANGEEVGEVTLYYNFDKNELVDLSTSVSEYSKFDILNQINNTVDPEIKAIVDRYNEDTKDLGKQVLTTKLSGQFYSSEQLPNLMAEAIYEEAVDEDYEIDFAYTNSGRASHYNTTMTYSDLYNIFPFDNAVPIIEVTGREAANMLRYRNNMYRANPDLEIRYEGVYKVACLDYLAFHCNSDRDYDFFPGAKVLGYLTKNDENYTYREILKDYLLANPEKTFESSYYSNTNPIFAR
ncbi:MAG: bifunctional metallophosphatase/5'-nucleotidase [Firmicutes bacterium]|nr:bifunctional metallophosphatase/5'-nucleotidase [Candidatus Fiminaster equi]